MLKILRRANITVKILPPILGGTLIVLVIGTILLLSEARQLAQEQTENAQQALKIEQESGAQALTYALESKADAFGELLAQTAPDLILSSDYTALEFYRSKVTVDDDIVYATYLNPEGKSLTEFTKPEDNENIVEKRYMINFDGQVLGSVLIGLSTSNLNNQITLSDRRISTTIDQITETGASSVNRFSVILVAVIIAAMSFISIGMFLLFHFIVAKRLTATYTATANSGDLTIQLPDNEEDEIGQLRKSFNRYIGELRDTIQMLASDLTTLSSVASELHSSSNEQNQNANTQLKESIYVSDAMNEMTASAREVANITSNAANTAQNADEAASNGKQVVAQTVESINTLAQEVENTAGVVTTLQANSENIGSVLDVIRSVADQTNLLALNAAIEAARAGEQGRGFAVVADEVRTLASRTQESTEEIQQIILQLQNDSAQAVKAMEKGRAQANSSVAQAAKAGDSLEEITTAVSTIRDMNSQIASAAEEQTARSEEVKRNVEKINEVTELSNKIAERTSRVSEHLTQIVNRLETLIGKFKISA
ncbi:methyl-accepting chemotaxis protein [Kaarinaea lacus]